MTNQTEANLISGKEDSPAMSVEQIDVTLKRLRTERDTFQKVVEERDGEIFKLKKDFDIVCKSRDSEARLACDLRTSQDQIIERCAQAVAEKWPDAAKAIRQHVDGISGEDWGELNRENAALKAELSALKKRDEWVDVKERLPEKSGYVLTPHPVEDRSVPAWFTIYDNLFFFADRTINPTVWRELPEPPKRDLTEG